MSVTVYQLPGLKQHRRLEFSWLQNFRSKKSGKHIDQHNYYYIFEKKSLERVVNERKRSLLAEMPPAAA